MANHVIEVVTAYTAVLSCEEQEKLEDLRVGESATIYSNGTPSHLTQKLYGMHTKIRILSPDQKYRTFICTGIGGSVNGMTFTFQRIRDEAPWPEINVV